MGTAACALVTTATALAAGGACRCEGSVCRCSRGPGPALWAAQPAVPPAVPTLSWLSSVSGSVEYQRWRKAYRLPTPPCSAGASALQPADGGWERGQGVAEAAEAAEGAAAGGGLWVCGQAPCAGLPAMPGPHARFPLQARPPPKTAPGSQASGRRRSARQRLAWRKPSGTYSRPSGSRSPVNSISTCPEERVGRVAQGGRAGVRGGGSTALQAGSTPADSSRGVEVARRPGWQTARLVSPRRSRLAGWLAGWMAATPAHLPLAKHPPRKVGLLGRPRWHDAWLSVCVTQGGDAGCEAVWSQCRRRRRLLPGTARRLPLRWPLAARLLLRRRPRPSSGGSTVTTCLRRRPWAAELVAPQQCGLGSLPLAAFQPWLLWENQKLGEQSQLSRLRRCRSSAARPPPLALLPYLHQCARSIAIRLLSHAAGAARGRCGKPVRWPLSCATQSPQTQRWPAQPDSEQCIQSW